MPCWREIGNRVVRTLLTVSVLPMAVFYLVMMLSSVTWAVGATLAWYYAGILLRRLRRQPILGAAVLGALLLTLRAAVMLCTGSAFIYFLQPIAGTAATALVFAASALAARPLLDRMAHDFCPLPEAVSERLRAASYFRYLSLLWAVVYALNASGTLWLLTHASLGGFLMLKTVVSPMLTGSAVVISYLMFRFVMRREGVVIRWGGASRPTAAPGLA
jgi:uncharacterized membrane protein